MKIQPTKTTQRRKSKRICAKRDISHGLDEESFERILRRWQIHAGDISSSGIEIGVYTEIISQLEDKMKHIENNDPRKKILRGELIKYVGERRRLLNYLKETDYSRFTQSNDRLSA